MCSSCDSDKKTIANNTIKKRNNSAKLKVLRKEKKSKAEYYTRSAKNTKDPRSKANYRNQKTQSNLSFDSKIKSLVMENNKISESNKKLRDSIKRRHPK